jgi:MtrB/PioB family decaheme-associated outer membrane protein
MKKQPLSKRSPVFCAILLLPTLWVIPAIAQSQSPDTPAAPAANSDSKESAKAPDPKDGPPPAQPEKGVFSREFKTSFEIGGQIVDVSGERPSKFEEAKRVREGFMLRKFRIASNPALNPAFFNLVGRGASERDERYLLDMGRFGKFHTTAEYARFPLLYARGARSLLSYSGAGTLTVPDNVQQTLQNAAVVDLSGLVNGFIAQSRALNLRTQRAMLEIKQTVNLTSHWSARARFVDIKKYGSRPMGTGSYERIGTPSGDTFRVLSIELPEPVDHRTRDLTVGTSYVRSNWGVNFDYTYSTFDNRIPTLTFDNPFRITDLQATGSGGVFDRMAFARGIFSLPPSNKAHSFLISAFVDLPRHSRLATALGWSLWRQDEEFAPYTLNSAIVASNIPAGTKITDGSALPRKSLEGQVDTFTQDHLFTTQLFKNVSLNVHYRDYDYENNTEHILFPGYAAFGESFWRTNINTKPIANEPVSFRKKTASADITWAVIKPLDWKFDYKWEGWDRTNRQVKESDEHTVGAQISFSPKPQFSSKLRYHYSDRSPREYDPGILEYVNLRLFDQAKRLRHNADFQMQYQIRPGLGVSGSIGYLGDDYDQNFFGRTKFVQGYGSLDLLYTPLENTTLYANYSRERYASVLQSIAKTAVPFDLNNRWNRDERDLVDSFGAGVTTYLAKDKLFLDVHVALATARTRTSTTNPRTPTANSLINATGYPFPDVKTRFHEVNSDVSYQLTPKIAVGFRYLYEPYRLNDFEWNDLTPYPFAVLAPEQEGRRFLLLDSRYSSHTAHTVGIYMRFSL